MPQADQQLTTDLLVQKGYFPTELAPPFTTLPLSTCVADLQSLKNAKPASSKSALFSIPKGWPARRILSVPNPLHQILLSSSVEQNWTALRERLAQSSISLSTPTIFPGGLRAVSRRANFDEWGEQRFQRSANSRFVLHADFSRYYHTIYTHSLPWAIHGKQRAKKDHTDGLFGNVLDRRVRNTQDQQTMGLPVGPDTSLILAEVIGVTIDQDLENELPGLGGTRYTDDFHLYFDSRAEAESAYAVLTRIAKRYELEINDRKTMIYEGPDTGEPPWKTALRGQSLFGTRTGQRSSFVSFASRAFELFRQYPSESGVLGYAVKRAAGVELDPNNSDIFEAFLRASIVHDASTMPLVTKLLFERHQSDEIADVQEIVDCLSSQIAFHAPLRHQYEVCWALWLLRVLRAELHESVVQALGRFDDPFVALLSLDLRDIGLAPDLDTQCWEAVMTEDNLYTEYWILAYEAARRGWLAPVTGGYLSADQFFSELASASVSFYEPPDDSGVEYITFFSEGYSG